MISFITLSATSIPDVFYSIHHLWSYSLDRVLVYLRVPNKSFGAGYFNVADPSKGRTWRRLLCFHVAFCKEPYH